MFVYSKWKVKCKQIIDECQRPIKVEDFIALKKVRIDIGSVKAP